MTSNQASNKRKINQLEREGAVFSPLLEPLQCPDTGNGENPLSPIVGRMK
jgi:hypothetical protein